jgi:hypothetical protein
MKYHLFGKDSGWCKLVDENGNWRDVLASEFDVRWKRAGDYWVEIRKPKPSEKDEPKKPKPKATTTDIKPE